MLMAAPYRWDLARPRPRQSATHAKLTPEGRGSNARSPPSAQDLLQLIADLIEADLDAGLIFLAAGSTRYGCRADDILADLDRQSAPRGREAGEKLRAHLRIVLQPLFHVARGNPKGARGERLLEGIFHGMGAGAVAADLNHDLADAPHDHGRNLVTLGLAISHRGGRDGHGDIRRDVFVGERLGQRRRGQRTDDCSECDARAKHEIPPPSRKTCATNLPSASRERVIAGPAVDG